MDETAAVALQPDEARGSRVDDTYPSKLTRLAPGQLGLRGGHLFVSGLSDRPDFLRIGALLRDPALAAGTTKEERFWYALNPKRPEDARQVIEDNGFQSITLCGLSGGVPKLRAAATAVGPALRAAAERGAVVTLFCVEMVTFLTRDVFGLPWDFGGWVYHESRATRCMHAALGRVAECLPARVGAKACQLVNVPAEHAWWVFRHEPDPTDGGSGGNGAAPALLVSVAGARVGRGWLVYMGDVGAERETCAVAATAILRLARPPAAP